MQREKKNKDVIKWSRIELRQITGGKTVMGVWLVNPQRDKHTGAGGEPLTLAVVVVAGGTGQLWLEVDLLGEAPLDDGRDLRPR